MLVRSRSLLSDGRAADRLYREAIERLERTRVALQLARTHLLYGEWLRRDNGRRELFVSPRTVEWHLRNVFTKLAVNSRNMVDRDVVVVCGGGGGAPVTEDSIGRVSGVDAVVDKDLTAAQLGLTMAADRLLVLTDVPGIVRGYGTPRAEPIRAIDADTLADLPFAAGSMGPKVDACVWFIRASGRPAAIGALTDAGDVLAGHAGTTITPPTQSALR